jgi:hypothetical protein
MTLVRVNGLESPAPAPVLVALFHVVPIKLEPASWQDLQLVLISAEA